MHARMQNPVYQFPGALQAMQALAKSTENSGVPCTTFELVHLRASQINGCGFCVQMHSRELKEAGESDERIWAVGAWRETPYFSQAERAALELTEAATRLADRADPVPDALWEEARRHYGEKELAALVLHIAQINVWNRINVTIRQPPEGVHARRHDAPVRQRATPG